MKREKSWLRNCLTIGLISLSAGFVSCKSAPPVVAWGITGDAGIYWHDPRLEEEKQDFLTTYPESVNSICLNPDDYAILMDWIFRKARPSVRFRLEQKYHLPQPQTQLIASE